MRRLVGLHLEINGRAEEVQYRAFYFSRYLNLNNGAKLQLNKSPELHYPKVQLGYQYHI